VGTAGTLGNVSIEVRDPRAAGSLGDVRVSKIVPVTNGAWKYSIPLSTLNDRTGLYTITVSSLDAQGVPYLGAFVVGSSEQHPFVNTHGLALFSDPEFGFTFWYPANLIVHVTDIQDDTAAYPGAVLKRGMSVGTEGGITIFEAESPNSTITDQPNGHAGPISQAKYFYDQAGTLMLAWPEGPCCQNQTGATSTVTIDTRTLDGLPILGSGQRFDSRIIPLSHTKFLISGDGGGMSASPLPQTVLLTGSVVKPSVLSAILAKAAADWGVK
jgi:hypothetical protein